MINYYYDLHNSEQLVAAPDLGQGEGAVRQNFSTHARGAGQGPSLSLATPHPTTDGSWHGIQSARPGAHTHKHASMLTLHVAVARYSWRYERSYA